MSALYIGLAVVCAAGVLGCLSAMFMIARGTPDRRLDVEA